MVEKPCIAQAEEEMDQDGAPMSAEMLAEEVARIKGYWENLTLLAETNQNIVGSRLDSLTSKCLHEVLRIAIDYNDIDLLKSCVALGLPLNDDSYFGVTPLMLCLDTNSPELVKEIINLGADVNTQSKKWDSPLHYCVVKNKLKAAEALIKVGKSYNLDLDILGSDGYAPLHKAAKLHKKEMIILLIESGSNVNVRGENGGTPLHVAANSGSEPCCDVS